jgi:H-NS histone family
VCYSQQRHLRRHLCLNPAPTRSRRVRRTLTKEIEVLQAQARAVREEEKAGVIARIREAIAVYELTPEELGLGRRPTQSAAPLKTSVSKPSKPSGARAADLVVAQPGLQVQAQCLSDSSHRDSVRWHQLGPEKR